MQENSAKNAGEMKGVLYSAGQGVHTQHISRLFYCSNLIKIINL